MAGLGIILGVVSWDTYRGNGIGYYVAASDINSALGIA